MQSTKPYKTRLELFSDCLDYLDSLTGEHSSPNKKKTYYYSTRNNPYAKWIDIVDSDLNKPVGFLVIGTDPNCHPDADYYIQEAYISPEYRRKGLMSKAVSDFIKEHEGTYCLFIIDNNEIALKFWSAVFKKTKYKSVNLSEIRVNGPYSLYGYKPNWEEETWIL